MIKPAGRPRACGYRGGWERGVGEEGGRERGNRGREMEGESVTHFALFPVQVELVLTYSHPPDSLDQRVAGIPGVDDQPCLAEGALRHCAPGEPKQERGTRP
jgi:hypothetical protein